MLQQLGLVPPKGPVMGEGVKAAVWASPPAPPVGVSQPLGLVAQLGAVG